MVTKRSLKCKKCKKFVDLYVNASRQSGKVSIPCKCGEIQTFTFSNKNK